MNRRNFLKVGASALGGLVLSPNALAEATALDEGMEHADLMGPVPLDEVIDIDNLNIGLKRILGVQYEDLQESDVVTLEVPEYAENGDKVAMEIYVNMPVEDVKAVHAFTDRNPDPYMHIMSMTPTGASKDSRLDSLYFISMIRLAEAAPVRVVVETLEGDLLLSSKPVNVGSGGCGAPS